MGEALTKSIRHEKCGRSVERRPCMTPLGVEHQSYACVLAYSVSPRIAMTPLGVEHNTGSTWRRTVVRPRIAMTPLGVEHIG